MAITQFPAPAGLTRLAVISSSGTWTHPDGASSGSPKPVFVVAIGGGGGGAGGSALHQAVNNVNARCAGGAGGASGFIAAMHTTVLNSVSVTIGSGGTGGAAVNSGGNLGYVGNDGNKGGDTSFGTNTMDSQVTVPILALGGGSGKRGYIGGHSSIPEKALPNSIGGWGSSRGGAGIASAIYDFQSGQSMGFGHQSGQSAGGHLAVFPTFASGGGGGGGGANLYNSVDLTSNGSAYYATPGASGGRGFLGTGGAGGGGSTLNGTVSPTGGTGGNGTGVGAGGGGGGGASNFPSNSTTATSGAGGSGSAGAVYIYY